MKTDKDFTVTFQVELLNNQRSMSRKAAALSALKTLQACDVVTATVTDNKRATKTRVTLRR